MKKYFILTFTLTLAFVLIAIPSSADVLSNAGINFQIISGIALEGNDYVADQEILSLIETEVGEFLNEEKIKSDLYAIYDLGYFQDVSVSLQPYQGGLKVIYELLEYPLVKDIILKGSESFTAEELIDLIDIEIDQILNQDKLFEGRLAIEELYHENGYVLATFTDINLSEDGVLTLELNEGYINEIIIKGNDKTEDYVIIRELEFFEGDVLNTEIIQRSFQRIVRLNIFEEFNPTLEPIKTGENKANIVIDLNEGKTGNLGAGVTWSSQDGWLGFINIQERNFMGRGQTIGFSWEFGGVTNYSISFNEPWLFGTPTSFGISLYDRTSTIEEGEDESEEHRRGGSISLGHRLVDDWNGRVRFKIEDSTRTSIEEDDEVEPEIEKSSVRSLTLQVNRDTTNHPFNPTSGSIDTFSIEYAGQMLGGDADFTKYNLDMRRYYPGFRDEHAWGFRVKAGASQGVLPSVERYRVGGSESLRGYQHGELTGTEMLLLNAEYRVPIADNFTGVVFADAGNAWDGLRNTDVKDLNFSYGAGIRMNTPIGQVRLDYGIKLEGGGQPHFSIGHAF
ncbi:BamA/OMP85 family outer membrane protein [Natronospora cellulosivora (SeqCode)]